MSAPRPWPAAPLAFGAVALAAYLGPVQSAIWNAGGAPAWIASVPWVAGSIERAERLFPAMPAYDVFGRMMVLAYGLLIAAVLATRTDVFGQRARIAWRVAVALLGVAALADTLAYWIAGLDGSALRSAAFWAVEVPALWCATLAFAAAGLLLPRSGTTGWTARLPLLLTPLLALLATAALQYMPHGPVLALSLSLLLFVWMKS